MKSLLLFALVPFAFAAIQDDSEKLRMAKIKAIGDWVGKWKGDLMMLGNSELSGMKMAGEVDVKWDLDQTALRFDGWAVAVPTSNQAKKLRFSGWVTFNHAAEYSKQQYTAVFATSEDGRFLLAHGDFKGKEMILDLEVTQESKEVPLQARVSGSDPRKVTVYIPATAGHKAMDWFEVTLRRDTGGGS